jgi:hypothetical protein
LLNVLLPANFGKVWTAKRPPIHISIFGRLKILEIKK